VLARCPKDEYWFSLSSKAKRRTECEPPNQKQNVEPKAKTPNQKQNAEPKTKRVEPKQNAEGVR
jgi:hypothetical protein